MTDPAHRTHHVGATSVGRIEDSGRRTLPIVRSASIETCVYNFTQPFAVKVWKHSPFDIYTSLVKNGAVYALTGVSIDDEAATAARVKQSNASLQ